MHLIKDRLASYLPLTVPFGSTGEHHGIINKLSKTHNVDLLGENYISLSSSSTRSGKIETLVNHGTGFYQSQSDGSSTYVQISCSKGYIFPTGYTLKGLTGGYRYAKTWYLYGIHEGDENNEEKWDTLDISDTTQSTFCQTLTSAGSCDDDRVGSFTTKKMPTSKGYKHLRWKLKDFRFFF